jgi:hypothetical protein
MLHDPHDLEAFAAALCRILDDPDYGRRLGQNAKARALWKPAARRMAALLDAK